MFDRGFKSWCENVAAQQRKLLGSGATDPINPKQLAGHMGIRVWDIDQVPGLDKQSIDVLTRENPSSWSAMTLSVGDKNLIVLNSGHYPTRQASDLMHEIAHVLIGHKGGRVDITDGGLLMRSNFDKKQEDEANWLAGTILLPRQAILKLRAKGMNDSEIGKMYGVSETMARFRISVSGVDLQLRRLKRSPHKIA